MKVWLFIGGIAYTLGDIVLKKWAVTNDKLFYAIGMIFYMSGMVILANSFKTVNIASASAMITIFNVIILAVISTFYYNEPLSMRQYIGIALAIGSIMLLE